MSPRPAAPPRAGRPGSPARRGPGRVPPVDGTAEGAGRGRPATAEGATGGPAPVEGADTGGGALETAATGGPVPSPAHRPLRVLHLLARSHRRGAELAAIELADELARLGHRNLLVALGPGLDGGEEPGLVPLHRSPGNGPRDLLPRLWKVRRLVARQQVDVVLAHGGWAAQVAALAVPRRGPLLVWQRILGFPVALWRSRWRRRWWRVVAHRFDAAVALTDDLADELRRLGFRGPVWVIPNARRPERFVEVDRRAAAAALRAELGVPAGVPVVAFVGHLVRQKRPELALEVLARLRARGCPAHLVVAGSGPLLPDLERAAASLGVTGAVTFLGHRSDVEQVFGGADLAVLTSEAEGIPGVAIEALMSGCPMVTVPVGGVTEVVEQGVTGVVLADHDPDGMAAAVARLLDDATARAAMSAEGRRRAPRYDASTTAAVYAERLTAALSPR